MGESSRFAGWERRTSDFNMPIAAGEREMFCLQRVLEILLVDSTSTTRGDLAESEQRRLRAPRACWSKEVFVS